MPEALDISSYPGLPIEQVDTDNDLLVLSNEDHPVASTNLGTFLSKSSIQKISHYFAKTVNLNIEPRKSKSNFFCNIAHQDILSSNSQLMGRVDLVTNTSRKITLPSLRLYKNYQSNSITFTNFENSFDFNVGSTENLLISRLYLDNQYYNIRCVFSSTNDSISFNYISYTQNKIFDTRINFVFESVI